MRKEIIINSTINEVRVAITEDGRLAEYNIELPDKEKFIGNVYLGKVTNIVQGISAAFVDIGFKNDAFLHFSDVDESLEKSFLVEEDDEDDELNDASASDSQSQIALRKVQAPKLRSDVFTFNTKRSGEVQINLQSGQIVIVQVTREAYGQKGVKVTSKVAIPGRYTVLLPFDNMIGVSRKIAHYNDRKFLRRTMRKILPEGYGCIIRTAARNASEEELRRDWEHLLEKWKNVISLVEHAEAPSLLYQDMELASSIVRDLFTNQVERVLIDSKKLYLEIANYLQWASPHLLEQVEYYTGKRPIFEEYGLEKDIANTHKRKIHLKSGASFVIDHTEAMLVIDVNSGRSAGDHKEELHLIPISKLCEIAGQIRLRDLAGMIVIDFIDMMDENHRRKLYNEMKKELMKDRAKTIVYPVTQLGLIQITRQRINQNIAEKVSDICPECAGTGRVQTKGVVINTIERWLANFRVDSNEFRLLMIVNSEIAEYLTEGALSRLSKLMIKYFVRIKLQQSDHLSPHQFKVYSIKRQKDITKDYL